MSTSLLYHGFGIRGYRYVKTEYEDGTVAFTVRQETDDLRCPACGSRRVIRRGVRQRQAYGFRDAEFFKLKIYALHETRHELVG